MSVATRFFRLLCNKAHWNPAFDRKCCIVHNQFFWIQVVKMLTMD
ncbi:hypothetical protein [Wolbachia endosymbiont (group A) of Bibio marci]|nr:hypothetical protein [Wolbachia endosymbiont (group A) of Bibio marci]